MNKMACECFESWADKWHMPFDGLLLFFFLFYFIFVLFLFHFRLFFFRCDVYYCFLSGALCVVFTVVLNIEKEMIGERMFYLVVFGNVVKCSFINSWIKYLLVGSKFMDTTEFFSASILLPI